MATMSSEHEVAKKPVFRELDSQIDLDQLETSEVESLCMNCHENGTTKILLTVVPMFREVIVSSFSCPHCGMRNSQVQSGAPVQNKGIRYKLHVREPKTLNRMMVKAESALVQLPELEFEIPAGHGQITTTESIIQQAITNLELDQPNRWETQPEIAGQIDAFIGKLRDCLEVKQPFTVILDDPAGNSFLQGAVGEKDSDLIVDYYQRSAEQEQVLMVGEGAEATSSADTGIEAHNGDIHNGDTHNGSAHGVAQNGGTQSGSSGLVGADEVLTIKDNCANCQSPVETNMKLVDIPHFKEVVIMASNCEYCGHRSNEVKSGSGISDLGTKITLKLTDASDLNRDILKSDTAMLLIPELDFEVQSGTLGGRFTTLEGLLVQTRDQLKNSCFLTGDSTSANTKEMFVAFEEKMTKIICGEMLGVHIILDDPAGNSYIQNVYAPDPDPCMTVLNYKRNFEQNESLGLNDMKTENYSSDDIS